MVLCSPGGRSSLFRHFSICALRLFVLVQQPGWLWNFEWRNSRCFGRRQNGGPTPFWPGGSFHSLMRYLRAALSSFGSNCRIRLAGMAFCLRFFVCFSASLPAVAFLPYSSFLFFPSLASFPVRIPMRSRAPACLTGAVVAHALRPVRSWHWRTFRSCSRIWLPSCWCFFRFWLDRSRNCMYFSLLVLLRRCIPFALVYRLVDSRHCFTAFQIGSVPFIICHGSSCFSASLPFPSVKVWGAKVDSYPVSLVSCRSIHVVVPCSSCLLFLVPICLNSLLDSMSTPYVPVMAGGFGFFIPRAGPRLVWRPLRVLHEHLQLRPGVLPLPPVGVAGCRGVHPMPPGAASADAGVECVPPMRCPAQ